MSIATIPPEPPAAPPPDSAWVIYLFLGGILLSALILGSSLVYIRHRHQVLNNTLEQAHVRGLIQEGVLVVPRAAALLRTRPDPLDARWREIPSVTVKLLAQNMAMPALERVSVPEVELRGVWDDFSIAFHLSWPDETLDANVDVSRMTDAAALQFPLEPHAYFMMGAKHAPVQILHWKALWQKDIDERFQDVQDVHPDYWTDLYWFAEPRDSSPMPRPLDRVPDSFGNPLSHLWFAAKSAKNPMSQFMRHQPVEELTAEGFGSLTTQAANQSQARGVWKNGRWFLVFLRPLRTEDPEDCQFRAGLRGQVAVSIWNGSAGDVGGRKQYSDWLPLEILR